MTEPVDLIDAFLRRDSEATYAWVTGDGPMNQQVNMPAASWRTYFQTVECTPIARAGVDRAIELAEHRGGVVGPSTISELCGSEFCSDLDVVTAWITTMCWGAGPRNKSRLRQWHRALEHANLPSKLHHVRDLVREGELAHAHKHAWLPGCQESFFTKWLWACGLPLTGDLDPQPLVYDDRVKKSLRLLGYSPTGRNRSVRWVEYCLAMQEWSSSLNNLSPGRRATSATIEHLLFVRSDDVGCDETLYSWLMESTAHAGA